MKKISFICGDKVYVQGKTRLENGIVCQSVDTTDKKLKVRVVMEDGKVSEKSVSNITKK